MSIEENFLRVRTERDEAIEQRDMLKKQFDELGEILTEMAKALKEWYVEEAKKTPVSKETKKFIGTWAFRIFRIISGTFGQPLHLRLWDVVRGLEGWRKVVCEITRDLYLWGMEE